MYNKGGRERPKPRACTENKKAPLFPNLPHEMASRMSSASAWAAPRASEPTFLRSHFECDDREEAFDRYQEYRHLEGTLATSDFWQYRDCLKDGFQATDEAGDVGCRGEIGNVACMSLDPARARYERIQQVLDASMERQLDVPSAVSDLFAAGLDLDEAYAKAGLPVPCGCSSSAPVRAAVAGDPAAGRVTGKGIRLAVGASPSIGMAVAAAFKGDRVVSVYDAGAITAYVGGRPANSPAAGGLAAAERAPGAKIWVRNMQEAGTGPSARGAMSTSAAGLYKTADASSLSTVWKA